MAKKELPLKEISINQLFSGTPKSVYEIPIYQRNYAWEKDEITALIQDVYDSYKKDSKRPYYIGTLVSYHKGDHVYEVIDGQQRLTTIRLILDALEVTPNNRLTYRARKKSDDTLKSIPKFDVEETDTGIVDGYKYAKNAIDERVSKEDLQGFTQYFLDYIHIIHYQVPKDIDLNHYFEIMNSRGEQLEKHEIEKANLMEVLEDDEERKVFNCIWEACSEMNVYVQQNLEMLIPEDIFGTSLHDFLPGDFEEIVINYLDKKKTQENALKSMSIEDIIHSTEGTQWIETKGEEAKKDSFLPIIDFPNFLLIVLKISEMDDPDFSPSDFILDDKELLNEFRDAEMNSDKVKIFAFNLLKARFFLDNYVVHHSKEEDTMDSNPWKLQVWHKDREVKKGYLKNLTDNKEFQDRLTHLLSMFEVSFTARQRKNYLFYVLLYLMKKGTDNIKDYAEFVENLADRYFNQVYLDSGKLNAINTPLPGSFDEVVLKDKLLNETPLKPKDKRVFLDIYGDGTEASRGVPLFVFNYLDYKIWKKYDSDVRGKEYKENSRERQEFFGKLGCGDFGLNVFDQFYFSRTRRSLEHFYPQANVEGLESDLDQNQINCLGNYAMIGSEANSSGSNWSPKTKLDHYLDPSGKISQISVASLKFMIMMQICKEHQNWEFEEIKEHQDKIISLLMEPTEMNIV